MLRENYADQENPSPLRSMEHSFRAYTGEEKGCGREKNVGKRPSGLCLFLRL